MVPVQCSIATLWQVLAVRPAARGQELCQVEVSLSRVGTHISGVGNSVALVRSSKDLLRSVHALDQRRLAEGHISLTTI